MPQVGIEELACTSIDVLDHLSPTEGDFQGEADLSATGAGSPAAFCPTTGMDNEMIQGGSLKTLQACTHMPRKLALLQYAHQVPAASWPLRVGLAVRAWQCSVMSRHWRECLPGALHDKAPAVSLAGRCRSRAAGPLYPPESCRYTHVETSLPPSPF